MVSGSKLAPLPRVHHKFVVVAHRGDHVELPENSVAAIEKAAKDGADYAEIDLRTTNDGRIVLMHDGTVDRMTASKGKVESFSFAELTAMSLRATKNPRPFTDNKVPSFEEILKAAHGKINLYLDIKAVTPEQVGPYLDKYKMRRNVIAYVYSTEQFNDWKRVLPDVPVITDSDVKTDAAAEAWWSSCPCEIIDGSFFEHTASEIAVYHRHGAVVWPDIQNPAEAPIQWDKALEAGVDGLQTDHPEALIAYLKSKKRR